MLKIFTEASYKVGFGHLARMSCIAEKARESGIDVSLLLDTNGQGNQLFHEDYIKYVDWLDTGKEAEYISSDDIVVLDSYHVDESRINSMRKQAKSLVVIDDNMRIDYKSLIIVNPNYFGEFIQYPQNNENDYKVGKDYTLLRKPFAPPEKKTATPDVKQILISFGGTDVGCMTEKVIQAVKTVNPDVAIHAVVTDSYNHLSSIQSLLRPADKLIRNATADEMAQLMRQVDFAITSAGGTSNELIKSQCPALIIPVADNQAWNAKVLQENNLAVSSYVVNVETVSAMFQQELRALLIANMKKKASASTGANFIISLCG